MLSPPLAGVPSAALRSSLEGSRLLALWRAFEGHVDALAAALYGLNSYSPFPFEVTVVVIVFSCIAIRQIVLWYFFDVPTKHAYVYWKLHDHIESAYYTLYLPSNHICTALLLYIVRKLWQEKPLTTAELRNKSFIINLLSLYSKPSEAELYGDVEGPMFSFRDKLMLPVKLPMYPFWTSTHQDGVEVCAWISTPRIKNTDSAARRSVFLRVRKDGSPGGGAAADAVLRRFVEDALNFYFINGYADTEHYDLRMYCPTVTPRHVMVKSVPLPLGPTLDTVFFPQREHVKSLLARFAEKTGRYAIQGFPHKLGFLLYGPRGTGKRSLVRALAYHTHRHIVRIPLSSFRRGDQLFKMFYFQPVLTSSTEEWALLSRKKVIFLIEDVNTNDDLVRARASEHVVRVRRPRGLTTLSSQQAATESSGAKELAAAKPASQDCISQASVQETVKVVTRTIERVPPPTSTLDAAGSGKSLVCQENGEDRLSLSSLLNILDGAVEDSDRIVVMIADHPEHLDPALLRPGRLATHLRFDYIELDDLIRLCGLFFGSECAEAPGTLTATGEATRQKAATGYSYGRMEASAATPPQKVHDGLLEVNECRRAELPPAVARALKDTGDDACRLQWLRQGLSASAADAKVKNKVIHHLSRKQAAQVRSCIAALEKEASSQSPQARERTPYNFLITPSHVHHLCMHAAGLNDFLEALSAYIRNESSSGAGIKCSSD
ncbi:a44l protein-like protein [Leishmania major strain Friedlin]|uniref:A44l protein-like protein n=1 Tax=Leishmania major TaxID=5664 RepID=Q4Q0H4_LEIMA|nr:a44l protein-like protein [Leishmania major strain Friedlin]CAG9584141.1 a44l_protein-like_protein [Leishmania major strain Friedlin]CAJ09561.1 a44l protein-like protein [Leishmania major strain Friedlin]|eukprot:XP_001687174.1 a44l protein-like protein [Leishmania major strain Friedlin]